MIGADRRMGFAVCATRKKESRRGNVFGFPCGNVGYELSSRVVSNEVLSPLQSLTSVFGMGTGGPSAFKTLTAVTGPLSGHRVLHIGFPPRSPERSNRTLSGRPSGVALRFSSALPRALAAGTAGWCAFGDSNPGPTD